MSTDRSETSLTGESRPGFFEHTPDTLQTLLESWGQPSYRASQILQWVYQRRAKEFDDMTNLPKGLRERLAKHMPLFRSTVARRQESDDGTIKLLLGWPDGATTECVLIPDRDRWTACISTQVGCPVGCLFCASGLDGLERQLSPGEIVEQAMRLQAVVGAIVGADAALSNVVFMGLGEPLANYDATVHGIRTLNAPWGMGIGARKITVSMVGLPKQIRRLADEGLQVTLALSLHAPEDELRVRLIPWAKRVSIDSLIDAANYFFEQTGREVTLEYILLGGTNDDPGYAHQLARVAHSIRCNINLIAYNPVEGLPYRRPDDEAISKFVEILRRRGITPHVRRSRGRDIDGACGQLRRREQTSRSGAETAAVARAEDQDVPPTSGPGD